MTFFLNQNSKPKTKFFISFVVHGTDDPIEETKIHDPKFEDVANIDVDQQLFQCKLCGKNFQKSKNLRLHLAGGDHNLPQFKHVSDTYIQCESCDMKFVHQSRLRRHVQQGKSKFFFMKSSGCQIKI